MIHLLLATALVLTPLPRLAQLPGTPAASRPTPELSARGHEPGWNVRIEDGQLTLVADYGATTLRMARPEPQPLPGGRRYAGNADGHVVIVTVIDRVCEDAATGVPHPHQVTVTIDEQALQGCGGEPASLLRGAAWTVDQIAGAPPVDGSKVSLEFGEDGRLSGVASCNRVNGTYAVTGEGIALSRLVTTRMACAQSVMEQERAVLGMLERAREFSIGRDGALTLRGADGQTLRARR